MDYDDRPRPRREPFADCLRVSLERFEDPNSNPLAVYGDWVELCEDVWDRSEDYLRGLRRLPDNQGFSLWGRFRASMHDALLELCTAARSREPEVTELIERLKAAAIGIGEVSYWAAQERLAS